MILYHGSDKVISKPLYGFGKKNNDYGQGFYCTEDIELAKEWACKDERGGFLNTYALNTEGLRILRLNDKSIIEWIAILLNNRIIRYSSPIEKRTAEYIISHFIIDITEYDAVIGYRADDSYFSYTRAFLSNTISLQQLSYAMKLGDLGLQFFVQSKEAFERLVFVESSMVSGEVYSSKRFLRDNFARMSFNKMLEEEVAEGIFARDILKGELGLNELCL
ncbi:MAG: DUF3990 domain-containing protein [Eubacterium sp.]|nr:DUF3990 domain-containing protein [Eubacterium sp.]